MAVWGGRGKIGTYLAAILVSRAAFLASSSLFAFVRILMRSSCRPDSFASSATWDWRVLVVVERVSMMWDSW